MIRPGHGHGILRPRHPRRPEQGQLVSVSLNFCLLLELFNIPPELAGFMNGNHSSQLLKSSSVEEYVERSLFFLESSIAWAVSSFGIATGNGRPFLKVICV